MQAIDYNNLPSGEPELLSEDATMAIAQITRTLNRLEINHVKIFTPTLKQRRKMRNMGMKPMKSVHRTKHK